MKLCHSRESRGTSIVEAVVAGAILALFLSGIYDANWRALSLLKSGVQGTAAARALQNRLEQIRTSTWSQITDPSYISGTVLTGTTLGTTSASGDLGNLTEKIDVNQYPLPSGDSPGAPVSPSGIEVVLNPNGTVTTTASGDGTIPYDNTIRVDITETWQTTLTGQSNSRMMSTIISQGGILGRNE